MAGPISGLIVRYDTLPRTQINSWYNLIPLFEKGELDFVVAGKDAYGGNSHILAQEPLTWFIGKDTEVCLHEELLNLVLQPAPCSFRKIAVERLEKGKKIIIF